MRTKSSLKNLIIAFIGQGFGLIISFVSRIIFIKVLSTEYLGINGLFTNILTMLSLVELGVGQAMTFSLYKPLSKDNTEKVKSLMYLYKKAYTVIGIVVSILGILFLPFYKYLINDIPNINNLNIIYLLFVMNTAVSYFYSYKRSLIICDQKRYIATIYRYGFYFILNVVQIIILIITKNYILYLILQVIFTWLENFFVSKKANKMYPYLLDKEINKLDRKETIEIKKNVKAMLYHKIGGVVVNSTDNILISKFVGLIAVGIYSNYYLIIIAIETITSQFFNAIIASVGNLGAVETKAKVKKTFETTFFLNFIVYGIISINLLILFNPIISVWLGRKYIFNYSIVIIITICFYLKGIRKTCLTYRDALGLFWYDRYKPIIESIINLIVSIILAIKYGVLGIFIGTIISTVLTSLWIEPYVVYKYYFKSKVSDYFIRLIKYTLLTIGVYFICYNICLIFNIDNVITILLKLILTTCISSLIFFIFFRGTVEYKNVKNIIKNLKGSKL